MLRSSGHLYDMQFGGQASALHHNLQYIRVRLLTRCLSQRGKHVELPVIIKFSGDPALASGLGPLVPVQ